MQTIRSAATLLARADSVDTLAPIIAAAGCGSDPAPLDVDTRRALGLGADVVDARVASGPGALRALMLELRGPRPLRETLPTLAARLATRAPHVLWLVAAVHRDKADVALAAWRDDRRPPRIAALLANRARIIDSDAETVAALCCTRPGDDLLTHSRWVDVLGRESLTRRFYSGLEHAIGELAASSINGSQADRAELALLHTSRLLFLCFIEAKGWLNGERDFLGARLDECTVLRGGFQRRVLAPLFFGTLNTPIRSRAPAARAFGRVPFLNGGLFARTPLDRRLRGVQFSDAAYGGLLHDVFGHYRFTAREEASDWTEVAVDPEMLGRALEALMASRDRKRSGSYFTPHELVVRTTDAALRELLERLEPVEARALDSVALLDPSCGSGAFLVHALEELAALRTQLGDDRPLAAIRRQVLTSNMFGVDANPMAVWLCELRLWLSIVVETDEADPEAVVPLPNLDHNVLVGDALAGPDFRHARALRSESLVLKRTRERYAAASGARKETLRRRLASLERQHTIASLDAELSSIAARRRELLAHARGYDLFGGRNQLTAGEHRDALALRQRASETRKSRRRVLDGGAVPFIFPARFADIAARGGFDVVVGNPPWVRIHHVASSVRATLRRDFEVARTGGWSAGASLAGAGVGFASQIDVAAVFVERCVNLLRPDGCLAMLLPAKLWRCLAGGSLRRLVLRDLSIRQLHDLSEAPASFDAAVYPSLFVATRAEEMPPRVDDSAPISVSVHSRGRGEIRWQGRVSDIHFDDSPGAPWLTLPPHVRRAFDRLRDVGMPLARVIGRPLLGVKCGCNDAFVVDGAPSGDTTTVRGTDGCVAEIETHVLRPVLRGETLVPWHNAPGREHIIWTHDAGGKPLPHLSPLVRAWLHPWRSQLLHRSDAHRASRWWALFRVEGARDDTPRVVWGDIGRAPRASVLAPGSRVVPLNSCYLLRCRSMEEAEALCTLLNGPLATAWLNALAEPARGGYRRYLAWTVALLPLPSSWRSACEILAPLAARASNGQLPSQRELLEASLAAYGTSRRVLAPLVAWCAS